MNQSFENVPLDEGTKIISQKELEVNGLKALRQQWVWDGIAAHSLIFFDSDVADLNDDQLVQHIKDGNIEGFEGKTTISRGDSGFTFVNFGFESF